ncbi:MAG: cyclic nucleotide-binding domain-containing protein [Deltaproteobacteria bacterium]|nr:cyclic nucleotide-binding domain-containing protein [Deltaproteobacteria bacterium]MBW2021062.1 cyclic nucleotide-binding domain-containing protein [Deltaproteobacteria bacterium]MBW2075714.1 cyclic nucleotide-binding domain-containing protein [Deltaproteobacteria bacterium]RLB80946.1 MAG: hypothetical protein DRH17_10645 [Deltaproteobacteria bacterium]
MSGFNTSKFGKNRVIFKEGSTGNVAYILKKGCVEISVKARGNKVVLTTLKPVTVFGEMALMLKEHKRTATATTLEDSELVEIHKSAFDQYIKSSPQVIATVLKAFTDRLQKTTERASRAPDIFIGTSQILNLLAIHEKRELSYHKTIEAISSALVVDIPMIKEMLSMMESFKLLELKQNALGQLMIHLPDDDFLERAMQIHEALESYSLKQKT